MDYVVREATPYHHVLRPDLRDRVGDVALRDFRGVRAADRSPHSDPYMPGPLGTKGARLADDPLAREVVLVRGGHRTSACGPPGHRGAQLRGRGGHPFAGLSSLTTFLMVFAIRLVNPTDGP